MTYDKVKAVLDEIRGMSRRQALDHYYMPSPEEWRRQMEQHGYVPPPSSAPGQPIPEVYKTNGQGAIAEITITNRGLGYPDRAPPAIAKVYAAPTPPPSSTPQTKEPDTNHMWDMLVLAARSSRYGE
jgi:hypothetical protein